MNCNTTIQIQSIHTAWFILSICHAVLQTTEISVVTTLIMHYLLSAEATSNIYTNQLFMTDVALLSTMITEAH